MPDNHRTPFFTRETIIRIDTALTFTIAAVAVLALLLGVL